MTPAPTDPLPTGRTTSTGSPANPGEGASVQPDAMVMMVLQVLEAHRLEARAERRAMKRLETRIAESAARFERAPEEDRAEAVGFQEQARRDREEDRAENRRAHEQTRAQFRRALDEHKAENAKAHEQTRRNREEHRADNARAHAQTRSDFRRALDELRAENAEAHAEAKAERQELREQITTLAEMIHQILGRLDKLEAAVLELQRDRAAELRRAETRQKERAARRWKVAMVVLGAALTLLAGVALTLIGS